MKSLKELITIDVDQIDYDRKTPYSFETLQTINGIKYKIIHTVRKGVSDSRIVSYEFIKVGV